MRPTHPTTAAVNRMTRDDRGPVADLAAGYGEDTIKLLSYREHPFSVDLIALYAHIAARYGRLALESR